MPELNRRWLLASRPKGDLQDSNFKRVEEPIPEPGDGEFVVRVTHLSFDPTQRGWLEMDTYVPAIGIGEVVRAAAIGQVVKSKHPRFNVGDLVQGSFGWQDYALTNGMTDIMPVSKVKPGVTPEEALGIYGTTGITAYIGLMEIGKPQPGETVLVSGAAGATGSIVIQLAKAAGCRVIGIAGGPEKCRWVTDVAGADACIDYKSQDVDARLQELAPEGVNLIYENVGGAILDAGLRHLAHYSRVVLCGAVSAYNAASPEEVYGLRSYMNLVGTRSRMEGFVILDHAPRFPAAVKALSGLLAEGKIKLVHDVQHGFENIPATLGRLFAGKNLGKQLLKIADPPLPLAQ